MSLLTLRTDKPGQGPAIEALRQTDASAAAAVQAAKERLASTPATLPRARYQAVYLLELAEEKAVVAREALDLALAEQSAQQKAERLAGFREELKPLARNASEAMAAAAKAMLALVTLHNDAFEQGVDLGEQVWLQEFIDGGHDSLIGNWRRSMTERGLL